LHKKNMVDLTKGQKSQYMFPDFPDKIKRDAEQQGFHADTSRLDREARATSNPPKTIANLRDGNEVVYEATDIDGKRIVVDRSGGSEVVVPSREALQGLASSTNGHETKASKPEFKHKGGDVEALESRCGDCGGHLEKRYYEIPGNVRSLLFSEIVCSDHPRGPAILERRHYEGPLGYLPPKMRKTSPPRGGVNP
jgi:hypothetical protein